MFCLPRLPRTLLSSDKQLMLSIVDHQWAGHSGAGLDFQAWRKARSVGMMPTRTVAAVVPALRRIIQSHVAGWKKVGHMTPEDPSRLVFDIAITWAVGERVRDAHPATVHDLHQAVHAISQAIFGAPLEFIPGTTAHKGVQCLPKAQVCGTFLAVLGARRRCVGGGS